MKINIEIDCTPDEARRFLGLPDVVPMQAEVMEMIQEKMRGTIEQMDAADIVAQWMPLGIEGMNQMQNMWAAFMAAAKRPEGNKT